MTQRTMDWYRAYCSKGRVIAERDAISLAAQFAINSEKAASATMWASKLKQAAAYMDNQTNVMYIGGKIKKCHCATYFEDNSSSYTKHTCSPKCRGERYVGGLSPSRKLKHSVRQRFNSMRHNCHNFRLWYAGIGDDGREHIATTYINKLQAGICELCGNKPDKTSHLHIDHNHSTGIPRGLLCNHCNIGLGHIERMFDADVPIDNLLDWLAQ